MRLHNIISACIIFEMITNQAEIKILQEQLQHKTNNYQKALQQISRILQSNNELHKSLKNEIYSREDIIESIKYSAEQQKSEIEDRIYKEKQAWERKQEQLNTKITDLKEIIFKQTFQREKTESVIQQKLRQFELKLNETELKHKQELEQNKNRYKLSLAQLNGINEDLNAKKKAETNDNHSIYNQLNSFLDQLKQKEVKINQLENQIYRNQYYQHQIHSLKVKISLLLDQNSILAKKLNLMNELAVENYHRESGPHQIRDFVNRMNFIIGLNKQMIEKSPKMWTILKNVISEYNYQLQKAHDKFYQQQTKIQKINQKNAQKIKKYQQKIQSYDKLLTKLYGSLEDNISNNAMKESMRQELPNSKCNVLTSGQASINQLQFHRITAQLENKLYTQRQKLREISEKYQKLRYREVEIQESHKNQVSSQNSEMKMLKEQLESEKNITERLQIEKLELTKSFESKLKQLMIKHAQFQDELKIIEAEKKLISTQNHQMFDPKIQSSLRKQLQHKEQIINQFRIKTKNLNAQISGGKIPENANQSVAIGQILIKLTLAFVQIESLTGRLAASEEQRQTQRKRFLDNMKYIDAKKNEEDSDLKFSLDKVRSHLNKVRDSQQTQERQIE